MLQVKVCLHMGDGPILSIIKGLFTRTVPVTVTIKF